MTPTRGAGAASRPQAAWPAFDDGRRWTGARTVPAPAPARRLDPDPGQGVGQGRLAGAEGGGRPPERAQDAHGDDDLDGAGQLGQLAGPGPGGQVRGGVAEVGGGDAEAAGGPEAGLGDQAGGVGRALGQRRDPHDRGVGREVGGAGEVVAGPRPRGDDDQPGGAVGAERAAQPADVVGQVAGDQQGLPGGALGQHPLGVGPVGDQRAHDRLGGQPFGQLVEQRATRPGHDQRAPGPGQREGVVERGAGGRAVAEPPAEGVTKDWFEHHGAGIGPRRPRLPRGGRDHPVG